MLIEQRTLHNHLLAGLSADDFGLVSPHLKTVDMPLRLPLVTPGELINFSWFPENGIISVITSMPDGRQVEAGLVGREGMVDMATLAGADRSPLHCMVQVKGVASRLPSAELRRAMAASETLRTRMALFAHTLVVQIAHTAFANAANTIEERLARWLLMAADRVSDGEAIAMTHEFLSTMLGVRRSGVTIAINALANAKAIVAGRGSVTIADRARLQALSNGAYGPPEAEYARLLGPLVRQITTNGTGAAAE